MLTREHYELLTQTGPGTPMGELFRAAMPQTVVKAGEAVEPVVERLRKEVGVV